MGIASLVLGIIGLLCCFSVITAPLGVIIASVGMALGICVIVKKGKNVKIGIGGLILSIVTFVILVAETCGFIIDFIAGDNLPTFAKWVEEFSYNLTHDEKDKTPSEFNKDYEEWEGVRTGDHVFSVVSVAKYNNMRETPTKIQCKFNGNYYEPDTILDMLEMNEQYMVTLYYNEDGYVNEISIISLGTTSTPQENDSTLNTITNTTSDTTISNTSWILQGDGSEMVFEGDEFKWYQNEDEHADNYYFGEYKFYSGDDAINYITTNLSSYGVTGSEIEGLIDRNSNYNRENFVVLYLKYDGLIVGGVDNGVNRETEPFYGFMLNNNTAINLVNMETASYFYFNKNS